MTWWLELILNILAVVVALIKLILYLLAQGGAAAAHFIERLPIK